MYFRLQVWQVICYPLVKWIEQKKRIQKTFLHISGNSETIASEFRENAKEMIPGKCQTIKQ